MSMDSWFPNPHDKDIAQLEEGLAYRAIKSGNNWILPSGKNAANGDPVVLDGVFGYATAAIVGGTDAIVEDTNWKPYGDGGALSALNSKMTIYEEGEETVSIGSSNKGSTKVTFSKTFPSAPFVIIKHNESSYYWYAGADSITTTGFTIRMSGDKSNVTKSVQWLAILPMNV